MIALAIIVFLPGEPPRSVQMGAMTSAAACNVAGRGAAAVFSETMRRRAAIQSVGQQLGGELRRLDCGQNDGGGRMVTATFPGIARAAATQWGRA